MGGARPCRDALAWQRSESLRGQWKATGGIVWTAPSEPPWLFCPEAREEEAAGLIQAGKRAVAVGGQKWHVLGSEGAW